MSTWPGWVGGIGLALVMLLHWFGVGRMMAVSGRVTAMVDRLRFGKAEGEDDEMSEEEMLAALRAETEATFGPQAIAPPAAMAEPARPVEPQRVPQPFLTHPRLFVAMAAGGLLATRGTDAVPTFLLRGEGFSNLVGGSQALAGVVLVFGGILVGFGTRMAGGCTSGHGLCGVSRGERGSMLATMAFFGAGVVTSFVLGSLL